MKFLFKIISCLVFLVIAERSFSQVSTIDSLFQSLDQLENYLFNRNHDTNFIESHSDKLALKLLANTKFNHFQLIDRASDNSVFYRPNLGLNFGFGFSYKWFALDFAFNTNIQENTVLSDKKTIDFQARMFSSKHYVESTLQYYYGYKMGRINGSVFDPELTNTIREDLRTISFGIQYLYVFNYDKFSLKAPFVMSEIQRKSAGSIVTGLSYNMFVFNADSSIVPLELQNEFNPKFNFTDLSSLSLAFKLGYMYSFVVKEHFFLTLGIIPGVCLNVGDYYYIERQRIHPHLAFNIKGFSGLGYNGHRMYAGVQLISDYYNVQIEKNALTRVGHGKLSLYVGYRIGRKK